MNTVNLSRRILCVGIVLSFIAACQTSKQRGWTAYDRGDFEGALESWRPLAEAGDADSQYLVGLIHDEGRGVPVDPRQAAIWYRMAAEQGHAPAQNNLGVLHFRGKGVPQSFDEAAQWYAKAAVQGFAPAQNNLGVLYLFGQAVPQDPGQAHSLIAKAALLGDGKAQRTLTSVERFRHRSQAEARPSLAAPPE
ncbi:MAG: tetratricopeptide repeat protein [Planctomycetota bacterium]